MSFLNFLNRFNRMPFNPDECGPVFWLNVSPAKIRYFFKGRCQADFVRQEGLYPIHLAAKFSSSEVLSELLRLGADPNQVYPNDPKIVAPLIFSQY